MSDSSGKNEQYYRDVILTVSGTVILLVIFVIGRFFWRRFYPRQQLPTAADVTAYEYVSSYLVEIPDYTEDDEKGSRKWILITEDLVEKAFARLGATTRGGAEEEGECSICLEDYNEERSQRFTSPQCSHSFHVKCVSKWVYTRGQITCPLCKTEFLSWKHKRENETPFESLARLLDAEISEAVDAKIAAISV